ncbi:MAG: response regulator transcription factor [Chloroflexota bacterium]
MTTQTILLIEDDPAVAKGLIEGLEREGYQVRWTSQGSLGVAAAIHEKPHLIILDVRLPDGSGFDVCRELRAKQQNQPILMLTVQADEVDKVLGLEMGADAYMTKPFSLRELFATVRALLRRAYGALSESSSNQLTAADIIIQLDQGAVYRGKETLQLTPTEYKLLIALARHPGQALSRGQLLTDVWGYDDVESEKTVNVHIRRLREKIELNPSQPQIIVTVPGIGYRLIN